MKRIVLTLVAVCFLTAFFNPTNSVASPAPLPDGGVSVQFDPNTYTVDEGAGTVTLTVRRTGDTSVMTVVGFNTLDGTAMAESDYTPVGGTLTFEPGETTQTIIVPIVNDTMLESNETFTANIFPEDIGDRVRNGLDGTAPLSTATVTIVDNDGAPTPSPTPANVQLGNISGRALVQTNEKVGICGFIISGGTGKRIIVRGIGPSLRNGSPPIAAALNDPMIELYNANAQVIGSNDSWRSAQQGEIQTSGLAPSDDREAAIIATLQPGAYTAIVRGAGNSSGVAVVEVYELQSDQGQLANVSVRADVLTDENVLINGVILVGGMPRQILFRAIGPDLRNRNISGELQDPILEVYDANGVVLESNDNWMTSPQAPQIIARGLQPNDQRESAVLLTLTAGHYTAIVRGVNRTTGVGVAEAYRLD